MHRTRYLIGLVALALAILGALALWNTLTSAKEEGGMALRVEFRDARGLRSGADVRYRGVRVGNVRSVQVAADGKKAVVDLVLADAGAEHACVNSSFWIVSPRFSGLAAGASGLDTLVRDAYVAFLTPDSNGSKLLAGALLLGDERPPAIVEPDALAPLAHGDLLMTLLVPENHGLRAGSPIVFRGTQTGDVRDVRLSDDGRYVEVQLRIDNRHRHTVTDASVFWVARPHLSGALLSGFTIADVAAIVSPFVGYATVPGKGAPVVDGHRASAAAERPDVAASEVPEEALVRAAASSTSPRDPIVLVRIVYDAVERDSLSADDPVHGEGAGILWFDRDGRAVVCTARSVVDGAYTTSETWGGSIDIAREQIRVAVPSGPVLRAHRVWIAPDDIDLALLVLDEAPPDLVGTPSNLLAFGADAPASSSARSIRADGAAVVRDDALSDLDAALVEFRGGALVEGGKASGILGQSASRKNRTGRAVPLSVVPEDLRPRP